MSGVDESGTSATGTSQGQQDPSASPALSQAASINSLDESAFEDYGDEIKEIVKTVNALKDVVGNSDAFAAINTRLAALENSVKGVVRTTVKEKVDTFHEAIEKVFPGIGQWGDDPVVNQWLVNTIDEMSGIDYMRLASMHAQNNNADAYIKIMNKFVEAHPSYKSTVAMRAQVAPNVKGGASTAESLNRNALHPLAYKDFQRLMGELTMQKQQGQISEGEYNKRFINLKNRLTGGRKAA